MYRKQVSCCLILIGVLLLFSACKKDTNLNTLTGSSESSHVELMTNVEEPPLVNSEGTAASLITSLSLSADAKFLTYDNAANNPEFDGRITSEKQIGPYLITIIAYVEKSDTLIFFADDTSFNDGMAHEKIVVESNPLADNANAAELIEKYPSLDQLLEEGISRQMIEKCNFSVFTDGYEIYYIGGDYLYHIVVNGDKELLEDTIELLK